VNILAAAAWIVLGAALAFVLLAGETLRRTWRG
jgi:hypothetical protein